MNPVLKKMTSLCAALALTAAVPCTVLAADPMDPNVQASLIATVEGLTESIVSLGDADIENYLASGDDFTINAMNSWVNAREELGELQGLKDTTVEFSDGQYVATVPADFSGYDADFVYVFEENGTPLSMNVNVKYPLSVNLERAALNTVMGLGTVFLMLIFLSFVISLFKYIPGLVEKRAKQPEEAPAPISASAPAAVISEPVPDDTELIAVIAAAIAASEGTSPDGLVVRSIRKINQKKW